MQVAWNRYHDHTQATKIIQDLAAEYPQIAKLRSLGKSHGGHNVGVGGVELCEGR